MSPRKPRAHDEIIALAARGFTNQQIADHCGITVRTLDRDRALHRELRDGIMAARAALAVEKPPAGHGTLACYRRGCRCDACRAANTDYHYASAMRRRARRGMPPPDERKGRPRATPPAPVVLQPRPVPLDVQIQQAIARGHTTSRIMADLNVHYDTVQAARDALDEAVAS